MNTLIKADIFFFISSVATVVLAVLLSVLLVYLIKAGRNLYKLSEAIKSDFKETEEFVSELKQRLEGNLVFRFFFPLSQRWRRMVAKDDSTKDSDQE
jgi:hypothetical protein